MATLPVPSADQNDFSKNKGEVIKCKQCKNAELPGPMRRHCKWCHGTGYTAICLPCKGTGKVTQIAVWDGKTQHGSTCDVCGGVGTIPSRESEYEQWQREHPAPVEGAGEEAKAEK